MSSQPPNPIHTCSIIPTVVGLVGQVQRVQDWQTGTAMKNTISDLKKHYYYMKCTDEMKGGMTNQQKRHHWSANRTTSCGQVGPVMAATKGPGDHLWQSKLIPDH